MKWELLIILYITSTYSIQYDSGEFIPFYDVSNLLSTNILPLRYLDFEVGFSKTFSSIPNVAVSILQMKMETHVIGHGIDLLIQAKSTQSFTLRVVAPTDGYLLRLKIFWFATNDPDILIIYRELSLTAGQIEFAALTLGNQVAVQHTESGFSFINGQSKFTTFLIGYGYSPGGPNQINIEPVVPMTGNTVTINIYKTAFITLAFVRFCMIWTNKVQSNLGWKNQILNLASPQSALQQFTDTFDTDLGTSFVIMQGISMFNINNEVNYEISSITKTSSSVSYSIGTCCAPTLVLGLRAHFFAISVPYEVCMQVYSECNFQGTKITICAPLEMSKAGVGIIKSVNMNDGYQILFFRTLDTKKKILMIKNDKHCINPFEFDTIQLIAAT